MLSLAGPSPADAADLSVYGKLPAIEDVVISGDGSRLAYLRTQGNERVVSVYTTDGHKPLRMVKVGHQKIRWIEWADADHLLITESYTLEWPGYRAWREQRPPFCSPTTRRTKSAARRTGAHPQAIPRA